MEDNTRKPANPIILKSEELQKYILETSVYPRELEPLKELRAITSNHPLAFFGTAPDAGQFMAMLLKLVNAKNTIEIGVFTGYSLLVTALTIPDDGKVFIRAMEQNVKKERDPFNSKGLLRSEQLYEYILQTSVYPREPEPLKELRQVTASHPRATMATAPDAGQLMAMLLDLVNAKKTIEIGVFTGYSLLLTALSIPEDGKIVAIDMNRESYEIGLPIIKKAGVEHKIDFIESEALPILNKLLEDSQNEGGFDYAFVDADKVNNYNYHEKLMKLLKVGGIAVYDNTLWGGTVAMPEELSSEQMKPVREATIELNKLLAADARVRISHVPLGDGITICRRIV